MLARFLPIVVAAALTVPCSIHGQPVATASRVDRDRPRWGALHVNEFLTPFTSFRIDAALLAEVAGFRQDASNRSQVGQVTGEIPDAVDLVTDCCASLAVTDFPTANSLSEPGKLPTMGKIRDSRFIFNGRLTTKRRITWQSGIMYDWAQEKWLVRQSAFIVAVPEIQSNFWIGRTKEGPSLNRVMIGYDGWTMERFTFSDAAIPLLADGVRWQGYLPKRHFFWNLGYFVDYLSEGESFSYFDNQIAGRVGYAKFDSDTAGRLLHLGLGFHHGIPNDGTLRLKSKPEAVPAPNFIDTGNFPSTGASLLGIEAYYRSDRWLLGTEYYVERAKSPQTGNPVFHGGDMSALWVHGSAPRVYVVPGSYFRAVHPVRSAFEGGWGAWEAGLRLSNIDLDAGTLEGGTFWRLTPLINWHLSDNVRLELEYGYGVLNRFGVRGATHFFQSRIQLQS